MMIVLSAPCVYADCSNVLIEELEIDHFGIFALNVVFPATVLYDENERLVLVFI